MQLYACLDSEPEDHHRMLYVFTCLSPQCIGDQRAVRVYRGYAQDDKRFAPAKEWDRVYAAKSDEELIKAGLMKPSEEKEEEDDIPEDENGLMDMKKVALELEESLVETDLEQEEVTKFYLKEARKMKTAAPAKQKGGKVQIVSVDEEDEEEDDDELENAFLEHSMTGKQDNKRVEKILKGVTKVDDKDEMVIDDGVEDSEEAKVEVKELEKIIEEKHSNFSKISRHYKLFDYVARADPGQVVRYIKSRSSAIEPLWMSEKN